MQRDVVSLHSPRPGLLRAGGVSENREVVQLRVAPEANDVGPVLDVLQNELVFNDLERLPVCLGREAGLHNGQGQLALVVVHVPQGQAVPVQRRVVPEYPLAVHVLKRGLGLLVGGQATQPRRRRSAHLRDRLRMGVSISVMRVLCCHTLLLHIKNSLRAVSCIAPVLRQEYTIRVKLVRTAS